MTHYQVVIPAAGSGKRMNAGKNKQFIEILGKPLVVYTLENFQEDEFCQEIALVVNESDLDVFKSLIAEYQLTKVKNLVIGGKERQESVYCGLKAITDEESIVLIHDGARPFFSKELVCRLVKEAVEKSAAIPAVPVKDTIKSVVDGTIQHTVDRSSLWAAQTPQAFRLSLVKNAHKQAEQLGFIGTDDASLVEKMNQRVSVVLGEYNNIKITTPEDLIQAEAIIKERITEGKK